MSIMSRDEVLARLRREMARGDWQRLDPDDRLAELETQLRTLADRLNDARDDYFETTDRDLLQALDHLAASLSYIRSDAGRLFRGLTRLADEIRTELKRLDDDEPSVERTIPLPGLDDELDSDSENESRGRNAPVQGDLFEEVA
jgi:chromosome segregation ATPase